MSEQQSLSLNQIDSTVSVGNDLKITAESVQLGRNVRIGNSVAIKVRRLQLDDDVQIDDGVFIQTNVFELGCGSRIEARCRLSGMGGGAAELVRIGEQTLIAHDSKILVPRIIIGDYTALHNHCLLNGRKPLVIGHNVWIGQNCILNSEDYLTIGNNVGIGPYSCVYTHGYYGDMLEGCQVFKIAPVVIEDDVWILGSYNVISPGVNLGEKCLVLTGSIVTKSVASNHTVGGLPARDLTERLVPYRDVRSNEKFERIQGFIEEFVEAVFPSSYEKTPTGFLVRASYGDFRIEFIPKVETESELPKQGVALIFTQNCQLSSASSNITIFDLKKRQYIRTRSKAEVELMRFLKSYRARFVPADNPRITFDC
jgi:acetyltransferase-like isoleucine patch superfamily enzyme